MSELTTNANVVCSGPMSDWVSLPSALTGSVLTYTIPRPIAELAAHLRTRVIPAPTRLPHAHWLLLPILADSDGEFGRSGKYSDLGQMHVAALTGKLKIASVCDLIEIGKRLDPRNLGIRKQISFGGGKSASVARFIYPPANVLPGLMSQLSEFLNTNLDDYVATEIAALVGNFAVDMHPFVDGNGRWSRLLTLAVGQRVSAAWEGIAVAALRKRGWSGVKGILRESSYKGFARYSELASQFESELYAKFDECGLIREMESIAEIISTGVRSQLVGAALLGELMWSGQLSGVRLRRVLNCSERKADGLLRDLSALRADGGCCVPIPCGLSCVPLFRRVAEAFDQATQHVI